MQTFWDSLLADKTLVDCANSAVELFTQYSCSEAVLLALLTQLHHPLASHAPRMATALCGGMCWHRGTCGAVIAASIAIGMVHGRDDSHGDTSPSRSRVRFMLDALQSKFSHISCVDIMGYDLGKPEERTLFYEEKCKERICSPYLHDTVVLSLWLIRANNSQIKAVQESWSI